MFEACGSPCVFESFWFAVSGDFGIDRRCICGDVGFVRLGEVLVGVRVRSARRPVGGVESA